MPVLLDIVLPVRRMLFYVRRRSEGGKVRLAGQVVYARQSDKVLAQLRQAKKNSLDGARRLA